LDEERDFFFKTLKLDQNADSAEVRTAFRKYSLNFHPDKAENASPEEKEKYKNLLNLYEKLGFK
jgi:DnaJ-class molecular chaperone